MARTYYNTGSAGRGHSRLVVSKIPNGFRLVIFDQHSGYYSVELNIEQLRDLGAQIELLTPGSSLPLMDGKID